MNTLNIWLVGAGGMAVDYVKVLNDLEATVTIIGRGEESARRMEEKCGIPVVRGGLEAFLKNTTTIPDAAIVAVGVEGLACTAMQLIEAGVKRVLLEKPGALYYSELQALHQRAEKFNAEVKIAYNRRMYSSVLTARKMIEEDGGAQSMHFEFTEWGHVIEALTKAPGVKEAWLLGNSTHVIDLAFYLGGVPIELYNLNNGSLSWHPSSSVFAGAGKTDRGVLFSYNANWDAPGRWGLEILTSQRRYIFRPMESLQIMKRGSIEIVPVEIDSVEDINFKPGLYNQVQEFLSVEGSIGLCSLKEQLEMWPIYEKIAGYVRG
ncbi:Gfo/Idh/MocA family protein [Chromobacterium haemolyticum]|uniref:Gfo/Idh/MocA family protein n=1 Tax=Chromobacterium haemolyticum TaxID=394935 RepID=UPI0009DB1753|nr:Gfo/Idh/MocA family oxidoreductase [Chromobacterium haemolyticum]OQS42508.1 myo-inositol 2-dehydrogenase [Chromobacterium haemolyticum]